MTTAPEQSMLPLRLRERDEPYGEPDVAAFCGRVRPRDDEPIGVVPGTRPPTSLVIFFQPSTFAIPAPLSEAELELSSWSIRTTAFGFVASVPRDRPRARASWVVAAFLPIALVSEAAAAPSVQRPKKVQVTPPPDAEEAPPPEPEPPALPAETTEPTTGSDPFVGEPGEGEATPEPPPPVPTASPSAQDRAIRDAAWEGVDGFDVVVVLKGDQYRRGRVGAVQRDTFTLIEAGTGSVLVLSKSAVVSLHAHAPRSSESLPPVPHQTGGGLIGGGVALTVVGAPLFITGVTFLGVCTSCTSLHLPMLLIGGGLLAGGIPMIVLGARRRRVWREAIESRGISGAVMPTRYGWTGGLRFRF